MMNKINILIVTFALFAIGMRPAPTAFDPVIHDQLQDALIVRNEVRAGKSISIADFSFADDQYIDRVADYFRAMLFQIEKTQVNPKLAGKYKYDFIFTDATHALDLFIVIHDMLLMLRQDGVLFIRVGKIHDVAGIEIAAQQLGIEAHFKDGVWLIKRKFVDYGVFELVAKDLLQIATLKRSA